MVLCLSGFLSCCSSSSPTFSQKTDPPPCLSNEPFPRTRWSCETPLWRFETQLHSFKNSFSAFFYSSNSTSSAEILSSRLLISWDTFSRSSRTSPISFCLHSIVDRSLHCSSSMYPMISWNSWYSASYVSHIIEHCLKFATRVPSFVLIDTSLLRPS